MRFVGGVLQESFVGRVREVGPERCVFVAVDVGKNIASALITDQPGEVIVDVFEFPMNEAGVAELSDRIDGAVAVRDAGFVRVGVEAAGHYHHTLVIRLCDLGRDVVVLNPTAVKEARAGQLRRRLKSDIRDLEAMSVLLARGEGRRPRTDAEAMIELAAWVGHRNRKIAAVTALSNQVQGQLDVLFGGLAACYRKILGTKSGMILVRELADPDRVQRLGRERLRRYMATRGVVMRRSKADQVVTAARLALRIPNGQRHVRGRILAADIAIYDRLRSEIAETDTQIEAVLAETPAAVLLSLPGVGAIRAARYGAAVGDPHRFPNAAAAYRASGLVPAEYQSATTRRSGQSISREGSVEFRSAIIELGRGLSLHDPDFAAYKQRLLTTEHKPPGVAAVAVGRRAHRLAFALMRTQTPYDPDTWRKGVKAGTSVMAATPATRTT